MLAAVFYRLAQERLRDAGSMFVIHLTRIGGCAFPQGRPSHLKFDSCGCIPEGD